MSIRLSAPIIMLVFLSTFILIPIIFVVGELVIPTIDVWEHLLNTLFPQMLLNTMILIVGVCVGTTIVGTLLAWLVTAYRFPGSRVFEFILVLPLAIPTYILAYAYMVMLDYSGIVQTTLRYLFGGSFYLPEIRSGGGVILVMTLALYPYVYILARAALYETSGHVIDTARVMGYSRVEAFFKMVLPLARPSIVAGLVLAIMEALTDFATVRFFNFPTLAEGIIRVWYGMMNLGAAIEIAGILLLLTLMIIYLEHVLRGRARFFQGLGKSKGIVKERIGGWRGMAATFVCSSIIIMAFLAPVAQLMFLAFEELSITPQTSLLKYLELVRNSVLLASLAAVTITAIATVLSNAAHVTGNKFVRTITRIATLGYSIPGVVIGIGSLAFLSSLDHLLNSFTSRYLGFNVGLIMTGSLFGLLYAYIVRFVTIAYNSSEAGFEKISPNITYSARVMATQRTVFIKIHLPLITPSIIAGMIIAFVDVMRELPITLLLRPFGYDTLAIWVWLMASESLWGGASLPALTIVLTSLIPVAFLMEGVRTYRR